MAAASGKTTSANDRPLCGARTRTGGTCRKPAGAGTDHVGFGSCKLHAGSTPNGRKHAARVVAESLAVELDLAPHDALMWCVRVAAGELAFLTTKVAQLEQTALLVEHVRERDSDDGSFVERTSNAQLHVWIRARQDAAERLAKFAKLAIDAGVAERHVRVAEQYGELIAQLIDGILGDLDLTPKQLRLAADAVPRRLRLIEGGAQAA